MENELIDKRQAVKVKLADFLEEDVGGKWNELRNKRMNLEAEIEQGHEVSSVVDLFNPRSMTGI